MAESMKKTTVALIIMTVIMMGIYVVCEMSLFRTLAITFGTAFYHFAMRLLVGGFYQKKYNNTISWKHKWFAVGSCEARAYEVLQVKKWKKHMPTYNSGYFDIKTQSCEQIAMAMCQAELVHETIIVFSFLPIVASVWFGAIGVFIVTSVVSAFIDLLFVILQRYNRPRILKAIKMPSR